MSIEAPPSRKPTMRDVSRLAGVSTMTVSRVLADPGLVAEETRLRVMTAIEQLGYVQDLVAGSLSSRRTHFIGLILPTLTNSNFGDTAEGLAAALAPDGYQLLIGYTLYRVAEEERLVRSMLAHRPVAIVLASSVHTPATRLMLDRSGVPVIEIWEHPAAPLDRAVGFSNYEAGRAAARHLIGLGHRRIGALGSRPGLDYVDHRGEARLAGFSAVLREAGLGDALVLRHGRAPVSFDHGATAMGVLLGEAPDVEAVFAVSDTCAFGALMECHRRGIVVPDRLSLLGFGDFDVGRQCVPALSTVSVDAQAIGRITGEMLLALLKDDAEALKGRGEARDIGFHIIDRGTTRARPPQRNGQARE